MTQAQNNFISSYRKLPPEFSIFLVLLGIALLFEILGWIFIGQSFLLNKRRLIIMILQVSVIGIIAVGVTQVIIMAGIDLSGGSLVALSAIVAGSLAQNSTYAKAIYPSLTDLPFMIPILAGIACGLFAGFISGNLIARTGIPPFIATLGMLVSARGASAWYNNGKPIINEIIGFLPWKMFECDIILEKKDHEMINKIKENISRVIKIMEEINNSDKKDIIYNKYYQKNE